MWTRGSVVQEEDSITELHHQSYLYVLEHFCAHGCHVENSSKHVPPRHRKGRTEKKGLQTSSPVLSRYRSRKQAL